MFAFINFAYDIIEVGLTPPPRPPKLVYATVEQLNQLKTKLTSQIDANQAENNVRFNKHEDKFDKLQDTVSKLVDILTWLNR